MTDARPTNEDVARAGAPADRLAQDVADLARDQVHRVRGDLVEAVRGAGGGGLLLGGAALCAVLAVGAGSATTLRMLEAFLPRRMAAAGLTLGYLAGAVVLGALGLERLRAAGGSSQRLAEEIGGVVSDNAGRILRAGRRGAGEGLRD